MTARDLERGAHDAQVATELVALGAKPDGPLACVAHVLARWLDNHPREANELAWQDHKRALAETMADLR
ncbi:MAG: hypothetical protein Q7V58_07250 [Actinomycetota bacterium]|nr:hypothetical protein [Actinomycetota bacterium]